MNGEYVYLFLLTGDIFRNEVRLARVERASIEELGRYTYWDSDTGTFVEDFSLAAPLFAEPLALLPGTVSWNPYLGRWMLVYNGALGAYVSVRTAPQPWGPWSEPGILFDCRRLYLQGPLGTHCYAAAEHVELSSSDGATVYVSVAGERTYRLYLHAVTFGSALSHAAQGADAPACVDCAALTALADRGPPVYVSVTPAPALSPIHRWTLEGGVQYAASSPGDGFIDEGVAFYARLTPDYSVWSEPVYRWDAPVEEGLPPVHVYSQIPPGPLYVRGPVAFFAPCLSDSDRDGTNDCVAAMRFYDPDHSDTDGDGCADAREEALGLDPTNPWDFYSVPVPALFAAPDPSVVPKDRIVSLRDVQAVMSYAHRTIRPGMPEYDQDANFNGVADGMEYDRTVYGDGSLGPPDGVISFKEAQKAYVQARTLRSCQ